MKTTHQNNFIKTNSKFLILKSIFTDNSKLNKSDEYQNIVCNCDNISNCYETHDFNEIEIDGTTCMLCSKANCNKINENKLCSYLHIGEFCRHNIIYHNGNFGYGKKDPNTNFNGCVFQKFALKVNMIDGNSIRIFVESVKSENTNRGYSLEEIANYINGKYDGTFLSEYKKMIFVNIEQFKYNINNLLENMIRHLFEKYEIENNEYNLSIIKKQITDYNMCKIFNMRTNYFVKKQFDSIEEIVNLYSFFVNNYCLSKEYRLINESEQFYCFINQYRLYENGFTFEEEKLLGNGDDVIFDEMNSFENDNLNYLSFKNDVMIEIEEINNIIDDFESNLDHQESILEKWNFKNINSENFNCLEHETKLTIIELLANEISKLQDDGEKNEEIGSRIYYLIYNYILNNSQIQNSAGIITGFILNLLKVNGYSKEYIIDVFEMFIDPSKLEEIINISDKWMLEIDNGNEKKEEKYHNDSNIRKGGEKYYNYSAEENKISFQKINNDLQENHQNKNYDGYQNKIKANGNIYTNQKNTKFKRFEKKVQKPKFEGTDKNHKFEKKENLLSWKLLENDVDKKEFYSNKEFDEKKKDTY